MAKFLSQVEFNQTQDLRWLPFTFERDGGNVYVTNMTGEIATLTNRQFSELATKEFDSEETVRFLLARQIIYRVGDNRPLQFLSLKFKTRTLPVAEHPSLHIFVVTLRCEHSCPYCQVSRAQAAGSGFDMSVETALAALDRVFESRSSGLKIEFQGGESLLNFELIKTIVLEGESRASAANRSIAFVVATNLALINGEMLDFFATHKVQISTSIDGPPELHNRNRPRKGSNSFEKARAGIDLARSVLGDEAVSALMTTTRASLDAPKEIIDTYVDLGFRSVFLRGLSPYGFAMKKKQFQMYGAKEWFNFYVEALEHVVNYNRGGVSLREEYSALILKRLLSNSDGRFADYQSPAGIGTKTILYNYDGAVYPSDESRMLAETGDITFRLGDVRDPLGALLNNEVLISAIDTSLLASVPGCSDCAIRVACAADPVQQWALYGDFVGKKATSPMCIRTKLVVKHLLSVMASDPYAKELFIRWANDN